MLTKATNISKWCWHHSSINIKY